MTDYTDYPHYDGPHERLSYLPPDADYDEDPNFWDGYISGARFAEYAELESTLEGLCLPCWTTAPGGPHCANGGECGTEQEAPR